MGERAMYARAAQMQKAFRNATRSAQELSGDHAPGGDAPEWAKLDMHEFQGIEDYDAIKGIIGDRLAAHGVGSTWFPDPETGKEYLLFRIATATTVRSTSARRMRARPPRRSKPRGPPAGRAPSSPASRRCGRSDGGRHHLGGGPLGHLLSRCEHIYSLPAVASRKPHLQPHRSANTSSLLSHRPRPPLARGCRARDGACGRLLGLVRMGVVPHPWDGAAPGRGARIRPLGHRARRP